MPAGESLLMGQVLQGEIKEWVTKERVDSKLDDRDRPLRGRRETGS